MEERIALHLDGSGLAREAIDAYRDQIAADTLATRLTVGHGAPFAGVHHEEHVLEGEPVALAGAPASSPPCTGTPVEVGNFAFGPAVNPSLPCVGATAGPRRGRNVASCDGPSRGPSRSKRA